jgi:mono/diheme cytochrome c family protein
MRSLIWTTFLVAACSRAAADDPKAAEIFGSVCARCHSADGSGGLAKDGMAAPRNFRDAAFQAARTDDQLRHVIKNGKPPAMPPFAAVVTDAQLDALVAKIRSFAPGRQP